MRRRPSRYLRSDDASASERRAAKPTNHMAVGRLRRPVSACAAKGPKPRMRQRGVGVTEAIHQRLGTEAGVNARRQERETATNGNTESVFFIRNFPLSRSARIRVDLPLLESCLIGENRFVVSKCVPMHQERYHSRAPPPAHYRTGSTTTYRGVVSHNGQANRAHRCLLLPRA